MSRSYKKHPIVKDNQNWAQKAANRHIRHSCDDVPNGSAYRKYYPQWDICDYWYHEEWKWTVRKYEHELQKYLNGGTYCWRQSLDKRKRNDPRRDEWDQRRYSYKGWYKTYKMK